MTTNHTVTDAEHILNTVGIIRFDTFGNAVKINVADILPPHIMKQIRTALKNAENVEGLVECLEDALTMIPKHEFFDAAHDIHKRAAVLITKLRKGG